MAAVTTLLLMGAPHSGSFSCGAQALGASFPVAQDVGSVLEALGLWSVGSVVVAQRLELLHDIRIFLDQGLNMCPLHWHADS